MLLIFLRVILFPAGLCLNSLGVREKSERVRFTAVQRDFMILSDCVLNSISTMYGIGERRKIYDLEQWEILETRDIIVE